MIIPRGPSIDPYSYLIRVAFVTEMLMILEVLSFMIEREELPDRFSISGTAV
jgi:hypothetical protein